MPRLPSTRAVLHGFGNLAALSLLQCLVGGIVILITGSVGTEAVAGPADPVLRLETGMHTANIWRIGMDAANRYLVTGSDDKTVRLWDLASGAWLKTFRPPLGEGNEGKIYAVAMSPDGQTVAAGGWTGFDWDNSFSIYLFDRASGRMIHRITGLPSAIHRLAYRPDGRRLVATLGGNNGIRVYRTRDYALVGEDRDYGGESYGAHFDAQGRLVTTSFDGFLRLYDQNIELLEKTKAPGGARPFGVEFSPDGTTIAVGYQDAAAVTVHASDTLALLFSPDVEGGSGGLSSVAWSRDGRTLYAGGQFGPGDALLRIWPNAGRGAGRNVRVAETSIFDLQPLQTGGVAFGAADPAWGVLTPADEVTRFHGPEQADYRDLDEGFRLSADGATVQFGYTYGGQDPAEFQVATRALVLDPSPDGALHAPQTTAPGLSITKWKHTVTPTLNGTPLALDPYEMSRALAIAPDQQTFLLGTEWYLRLFDRSGTQRWQVPVPGVTWAVNIAPNGQVAVAAFMDGTIRWYRLRDGQELLALFPHPGGRRWILWTPQGYYDAAAGAEDLLGWHVNQGPDKEALFYSVGQFRDRFYRPDVIARVLDTLDVRTALKQADTIRRPVGSSLFRVGDLKDPTSLAVKLRDASDPVSQFLQKQFSQTTQLLLSEYDDSTPPSGKLQAALIQELNQPLQGDSIYDEERFSQVILREETKKLIEQNPQGEDLISLNRLLLEDAYPHEIPPVGPLQKVLPPIVELVSPRDGIQVKDTDLLITFLLQSPSGDPVTELQGLVDGRVVTIRPNPLSRGQDELRGKLILPIPPQNVTIGLRAKNRHGTSAVATAQVSWAGLATARQSPNLYVLAIGVGSYPQASDIESLDFPAKGARELANLLENQAPGLYETVVTRVLLDGEATQDAIFDGLDWLEETTQSNDVAMLFLAGHGVTSKKGQFHFLPFDANLTRLRRTSVRGLELQDTLSRIRGRTVLFFDTSYSGQVLDLPGAKVLNPSQVNVDEVANVLAHSENGPIVFASSTGKQLSLENKELENGAFAAGLLEGLAGAADLNRDGFIMASELADYVAQRVADLTGGKQTPTTTNPKGLPDLKIAQVTP